MWPISEHKCVWYYEYGLIHIVALKDKESPRPIQYISWKPYRCLEKCLDLSSFSEVEINCSQINFISNTSSNFKWLLPNHKFSPTCRHFCINAFSLGGARNMPAKKQLYVCIFIYIYLSPHLVFSACPFLAKLQITLILLLEVQCTNNIFN